MEEFIEKMKTLVSEGGESLVLAIVALVVGIILIKVIKNIARKALFKSKMEKALAKFIVNVINVVLNLLLIYIIWDILKIPSTLFVAITSVAGIAISLALQGVLSNFASGILQLSAKRIKEGDYVKIGDVEGTVTDVDMMSTKLTTPDKKIIYVPNKNLTSHELINYSKSPIRRVDVEFSVAYGNSVEDIRSIIMGLITHDDRILTTPEPQVKMKEMGSSSIDFIARLHVNASDYWNVFYDMTEKIYSEFNNRGIEIPFNQIDVHMINKK